MLEMKHILVPVSAADESMQALSFAAEMAQIYDASLSLLLVTYFDEHTDGQKTAKSWLSSSLTGSVSRYTHAVFTKAAAHLPSGMSASYYHVSGQPQQKILEFAQANHTDLIIMSCRRLSFLDTLIGGSVSRHILEKSKCPVIIVK